MLRRFKDSLLFKQIMISCSTVVLVVVLLTEVTCNKVSDAITDEIEKQLDMTMESVINSVISSQESLESEIQLLTNLQIIRSFAAGLNRYQIKSILSDFTEQHSDIIENVFITDVSGNVLYTNTDNDVTNINVSSEDYFQSAVNGSLFWSDVQESASTGHRIQVIGYPIYNFKQEVVGILAASVNFSYVTEKLDQVKIGENGYAYLVDSEGDFIYHPNKELINSNLVDLGVKELDQTHITNIKSRQSGEIRYKYDGIEKINFYKPLKNWSLSINAATEEYLKPVTALENEMAEQLIASIASIKVME